MIRDHPVDMESARPRHESLSWQDGMCQFVKCALNSVTFMPVLCREHCVGYRISCYRLSQLFTRTSGKDTADLDALRLFVFLVTCVPGRRTFP